MEYAKINVAEGAGALDLPGAAAQFFDATLLIPMGAALLVSTTAYFVMRLYLRAIFRESQRTSSLCQISPFMECEPRSPPQSAIGPLEIQSEKPGARGTPSPARSSTFQHAGSAFRRAGYVYVFGGSIHAAMSTALLFFFRVYSLPSAISRLTVLACYGAVFWSWSFATVVGLALFFGSHRRLRGLLVLGYLGALPLAGVLLQLARAPALPFADLGLMSKDEAALVLAFASAVVRHPVTAAMVTFSPLIQPTLFWSLSASPVTIPLLAFNRFIRGTVGPLFITLALIMVLSTITLVNLVVYTSPGIWLASQITGVFGRSAFVVLLVSSGMLSAIVASLGLMWIARRYRHKRLSDQTFVFDALWLSVSLWLSAYLMGTTYRFGYLLGLLPFVVYKIVCRYGLKRLAESTKSSLNPNLLFLRVFGSSSRSEKLFDLLAARWRYAGTIEVISATDVARGRFEPDEFLDFISGRIAKAYIRSGVDLEQRLAELDVRPDPDGRYRVNEFFCRADTWQQTVTKLMAQSDLIVMDLRAFTSERKGVIFELGVLIDVVPLHRVVLLTDQTSDQPLLRRTLADLWGKMNPQSPNASFDALGGVRVRAIDVTYGDRFAVRQLLHIADELILPAA